MVAPFSFQSRWSGEEPGWPPCLAALLTADSWVRSVRMAENAKWQSGLAAKRHQSALLATIT
jgi:hypothetical protein